MILFERFTADLEYRDGQPALYLRMANGWRGRICYSVTLRAPLDVIFEGRTYTVEERPYLMTVDDIHTLVLEATIDNELKEPADAIHHAVRIPATPA